MTMVFNTRGYRNQWRNRQQAIRVIAPPESKSLNKKNFGAKIFAEN